MFDIAHRWVCLEGSKSFWDNAHPCENEHRAGEVDRGSGRRGVTFGSTAQGCSFRWAALTLAIGQGVRTTRDDEMAQDPRSRELRGNRILDALPSDVRERVFGHL